MPPLPALRPSAPLPPRGGPAPRLSDPRPGGPRFDGPGSSSRFPGPRSDGPRSHFPGPRPPGGPSGPRGPVGRGFRHSGPSPAPFGFDDFREERLKIMQEIGVVEDANAFDLPFARNDPKPPPVPAQVFDYSHGRSADADSKMSTYGDQDQRPNTFGKV